MSVKQTTTNEKEQTLASSDSFIKTIAVAVVLCLVCSIIVSSAAVLLKDKQETNALLDKKRNVLIAANVLTPKTDIEAAFAKIEQRFVDLSSGEFVSISNENNFDQRQAAKNSDTNVAIENDIAKIGRRSKVATVYLVIDNSQLKTIVLPIHGKGLFSTLYGFIAIKADKQTIVGLKFYEQGETPGLGGEVENPNWLNLWTGKKLFDTEGQLVFKLVKGVARNEYEVDALSGATMTSRGIQNMIDYWLGKQAFGLFLSKFDVSQINSDKGDS